MEKSGAGFTLIELIIVIALISIFIAGAIAVLDPLAQIQKANDARRKSDLTQIQKALESHYDDFQKYPLSSGSPNYQIQYPDGASLSWGSQFSIYMNKLPQDPKSNRRYIYFVSSNRQSYWLYASLERGAKDPSACNGECASISSNGITANACSSPGGSLACNYALSSSNVSP